MSTTMTDLRQAVWNTLEADLDFTTFMGNGRRFDFEAGSFDPTALAAPDCPCLSITPEGTAERITDPAHPTVVHTLALRGVVASAEVERIETFHRVTAAALVTGWPDFGRAEVLRFALPGVAFKGPADRPALPGSWQFTLKLEVVLDRELAASAD